MNTKYYCPICGYELEWPYGTGDICPCCGNECGFSEYNIIKDGIDENKYNDYCVQSGEYLMKGLKVPKEIKDFLSKARFTREEAFEKLREIWIKKGCEFECNFYNERPKDWGINLAKRQLLNINIDLDKLLNEYK